LRHLATVSVAERRNFGSGGAGESGVPAPDAQRRTPSDPRTTSPTGGKVASGDDPRSVQARRESRNRDRRRALAVPTDVTITEQLDALVAATIAEFGRIDILVNNAGGWLPRPVLETSERAFEAALRFNVTAAFLLTKAVVPHMVAGGGGSVVNISSRAAKDMGPNLKNGPYGASKSAVNSLTATFSRELAPKIRVNAVAPGPIPTENFIDSMKMHTPEREAELKEYIKLPLERWGTPEDIGAAVLYMVSPASSWVTGQCLYVTGGS